MNGDLDLSVQKKKALDTEIKEIGFMQAQVNLYFSYSTDITFISIPKSAQYFYI